MSKISTWQSPGFPRYPTRVEIKLTFVYDAQGRLTLPDETLLAVPKLKTYATEETHRLPFL